MLLHVRHRVEVLRAVATDERFLTGVVVNVRLKLFLTAREISLVEMDAAHRASSVVGVRGRRSQPVGELCVGCQVEAEVRQV